MRLGHLIFSQVVIFSVYALPEGLQVVSGEASVSSNEQTCFVQNGKDAILHWDRFSIGKNENVHFIQPNSSSSVLNRVVGGAESQLLGAMESNGKIYLINPSGIFIGPDARIISAGFIASISDVLDESFLNGEDLQFFGSGVGSVINLGSIRCPTGDIVFIGKTVRNEGDLSSPEGLTALVTGSDVLLKVDGSERVFIAPDFSDGSVDHSGTIVALAAELKSGVSPFGKAVRVSGKIDASCLRKENGRVYLVTDGGLAQLEGTITALNGEVKVLGKEVVFGESLIDVSGENEGGTVYIGAKQTFVSADSIVRADCLQSGNGGSVVFWGDEKMEFHGSVSANGGSFSGDGGFVEVSSSGAYGFDGLVSTIAPFGKMGTLLLDPIDITISNVTSGNISVTACPGSTVTGTSGVSGTVDVASIQTNLMTCNVTIDSSCGGCGGNGDITFSGANPLTITVGSTGNLIVNAFRDIVIDGAITNNSLSSSMTFTAGTGGSGAITVNDTITQGGVGATGLLTMTAPGDINSLSVLILSNSTGTTFLHSTAGNIIFGGYTGTEASTLQLDAFGSITSSGISNTASGSPFVAFDFTAAGNITAGTPVVGVSLQGSISTVDGDLVVHGTSLGNSNSGNIGVNIHGIFINSTGNGKVNITGQGGPGTDSNYGIQINDSTIVQINVVNGDMTLTGSAGLGSGFDNKGIISPPGSVTAFNSTGSGKIIMNGTGGSGTNDAVGIHLATGPITSSGSGDISLTGLGGSSSVGNLGLLLASQISASNGANITLNGTGGTAGTGNNGINIAANITSADGTIIVNGASGAGTTTGVYMGSNTVSTIGIGSIQINTLAGDFIIQNGSLISASGTGTLTGTIAGDLTLEANFKFAPIIQTFDGIIDITANGSIRMTGDPAGNNPRIQSLGASSLMRLVAGQDIVLTANGAGHALILPAGDTILIVDNLFPTAPGHGTGSLQMDPGVDFGSIIKLATGELRIYTSQQSLNYIHPSDTINTAPYVMGIVGVDDAYHQWSIYAPGGTYGGPEYTFYFKEPFSSPIPPTPTPTPGSVSSPIFFIQAINQAVIANSQLNELLPFYYPFHKADIENDEIHSQYVFPRFEAFIFSNEVY